MTHMFTFFLLYQKVHIYFQSDLWIWVVYLAIQILSVQKYVLFLKFHYQEEIHVDIDRETTKLFPHSYQNALPLHIPCWRQRLAIAFQNKDDYLNHRTWFWAIRCFICIFLCHLFIHYNLSSNYITMGHSYVWSNRWSRSMPSVFSPAHTSALIWEKRRRNKQKRKSSSIFNMWPWLLQRNVQCNNFNFSKNKTPKTTNSTYTVEPRYNEVLGTMKMTLLYQVSHYIRVKNKEIQRAGTSKITLL